MFMDDTSKRKPICYACDKEIIEREVPADKVPGMKQMVGTKIGRYTLRRVHYDDDWHEIIDDLHFHEECWFKGFAFAIKHGYLYADQMKAFKDYFGGNGN